jgi:acetyl esterase/lipase
MNTRPPPYCLFGQAGNVRGFPPVLLQVGGTEILTEGAQRLAAALEQATVAVDLQIWPGLPHAFSSGCTRRRPGTASPIELAPTAPQSTNPSVRTDRDPQPDTHWDERAFDQSAKVETGARPW